MELMWRPLRALKQGASPTTSILRLLIDYAYDTIGDCVEEHSMNAAG